MSDRKNESKREDEHIWAADIAARYKGAPKKDILKALLERQAVEKSKRKKAK